MRSKPYDSAMPIMSHAIIGYYRLHRRAYLSKNFFIRKILCKIMSIFNQILIQSIFHCILPKEAQIGKNFMMPHPFGVMLSPNATIGDNVKIMHHVTFGHNELSEESLGQMIIGDNVYIAPGALILSNALTIGEGSIIGPNVVVLKDVPPGSVLICAPPYNVGKVQKKDPSLPD